MKKTLVFIFAIIAGIVAMIAYVRKFKELKGSAQLKKMSIPHMYQDYFKRGIDIFCSLLAIICFGWLYIIIAILVKIKLGSPVLFKQPRPGKDEKIFNMYKFRTMTDEKDKEGNLLPDEKRLTQFGKKLRATSLDELPEVFNILKGDMSIVGPRPQLVRDMVFMSDEHRKRHSVRPGLSGLAQVNGRNDIDWEDKLNWDLKYIKHISFLGDLSIILKTVLKVFVKQEGITSGDMATAEDYGDYLLYKGVVCKEEYIRKQEEALKLLNDDCFENIEQNELVSIITPSYNTAKFIAQTIESVLNQTYKNWEMIIVDDCSTDNTDDVVKEYLKDRRIKYLKNKNNSGAAISRNYALREAKGKWIAFLDSDDLWLPEKLERQIEFMRENDYHFSYTEYGEINEENLSLETYITGPKKIDKFKMYSYCWVGCLTVMYDTERVGLIQIDDLRKNNDYAMWLKIICKSDCYLLNRKLALYRKRKGSISNHSYYKLIRWHFLLFQNIGFGYIKSSVFTIINIICGIFKKIVFKKRN